MNIENRQDPEVNIFKYILLCIVIICIIKWIFFDNN